MDRQAAGGGLGECHSERDTRAPLWMITGDRETVGELTSGDISTEPDGSVVAPANADDLTGEQISVVPQNRRSRPGKIGTCDLRIRSQPVAGDSGR